MLLNELRDLVSMDSAPDIEVHGVDPSIYLIFSCEGRLQDTHQGPRRQQPHFSQPKQGIGRFKRYRRETRRLCAQVCLRRDGRGR